MKKLMMSLVTPMVLLSVGFAAPKARTFSGEIMDSQCAAMGSHEMMMKKEGMGDKNPNDPMAKKMCTNNCVKMGGKYVLYNGTKKVVYQLDDQTKPEQFAGQKVRVKGTYDKTTKTIHVTDIQLAS